MSPRAFLRVQIRRFVRNERGAAALEYALVIGLVVVIVGLVSVLGSNVSRIFGGVTVVLNKTQDTCTGVPVGQHCNRARSDGSGVDDVVVAQVNTLYVWPTDEPAGLPWNNASASFTTTGASSTTNGMSNTNTLLALNDASAPYQAAVACRAHGPDWYLPALNELLTAQNAAGQNGVGSLSFNSSASNPVGFYWASSEVGSNHAYQTYYSAGWSNNFGFFNKNSGLSIRCVHK